MILDSDFDIISRVNDAIFFTGTRQVVFTSNIRNIEIEGERYDAAQAKIINNDGDLLYRCEVVFDREDVIHIPGTYYASSYDLPAAYDKKGQRTGRGMRIKSRSFELHSKSTDVYESKFYNHKTGNWEITRNYRIYTTAASLKKIKDIDVEAYRLVYYDTKAEETRKIESVVENFNGHHRIQFMTGVYRNNDGLFAKADVDGKTLVISMDNVEMKITEPNRWAPYYTYRPILKGRGTTIKNNFFEVDVVETKVANKNTWDEDQEATLVEHRYVLVINPNTIVKTK